MGIDEEISKAVRALREDSEIVVVTTDIYRRRDIAVAYVESISRHDRILGSRWMGSYWVRLLNRIIPKEEIDSLPEPKPKLHFDGKLNV